MVTRRRAVPFALSLLKFGSHEAVVMNQYAGTLIVCVCLGAIAAVGAGCDSASDASSGGTGTTTGGTGATTGGTGATTGGTGATTGGTGNTTGGTGAMIGTEVLLPSDPT